MSETLIRILQPVMYALIDLLVLAITILIYSAKDHLNAWVKSRTTADQQRVIDAVAKEAHAYAEQWFAEYGGDKLRTAVDYACKQLEKRGIAFDPAKVTAAIQAAWLEHNKGKPVAIQTNVTTAGGDSAEIGQRIKSAIQESGILRGPGA